MIRLGARKGLTPAHSFAKFRLHIINRKTELLGELLHACPVCTYMKAPAVVAFAKPGEKTQQMVQQLERLLSEHRGTPLRAFVVVLDTTPAMVSIMADSSRLRLTSLCYLDPKTREKDLAKYKIDPSVENSVMVYKDYKVLANFNNLDVSRGEAELEKAVESALGRRLTPAPEDGP